MDALTQLHNLITFKAVFLTAFSGLFRVEEIEFSKSNPQNVIQLQNVRLSGR